MMNYYNYFTEIEEHFVRKRGKHLLISPMDWGLIASWREAGVPLNVALRGIDIAMDGFHARQRAGSKVNSLCYCHDSVMTEYAAHLDSRVGESAPDAPTGTGAAQAGSGPNEDLGAVEVAGFLSERINEIKALSGKQYSESEPEGLHRVVARLEEVLRNQEGTDRIDSESMERDLAIIDDLLVTELRALVTPQDELEWEKEAKKELKVYRKRLPKETFDKIRENFMRDKIHRKFGIGELSLFRL